MFIYIRDQTALHLDVHVEGGTRRAGAPLTTITGFFVLGYPTS
ncbi:hypothetical protein [Methylobacterium sp. XJLW]|nr:hypothetical protein [Methylobacterium sp. XJLW]